jgi:hypothetical protein
MQDTGCEFRDPTIQLPASRISYPESRISWPASPIYVQVAGFRFSVRLAPRRSSLDFLFRQLASFTSGTFQVPSRMEGGFSFGQYSRIIRTNASAGAGNQFASLSFPGESCWT